MSNTGRRSSNTPEVIARVEAALVSGASWKVAARYAGVTPWSLRKYRHEDRELSRRLTALYGGRLMDRVSRWELLRRVGSSVTREDLQAAEKAICRMSQERNRDGGD